MPPFFMEPRKVDFSDYVTIYQAKYQELFNQSISFEARLNVVSEYATELQEKILELQNENAHLKSELNKKATSSRKKSPAEPSESTFVDAEGV